MIPVALKILGAVSGTALLATTTFIVVPIVAPTVHPTVWLDAPADGAVLEEGPLALTLHSSIANVTRLTVSVELDGVQTQKLTSQSVERTARGAKAIALAAATLQWTPKPGKYTLRFGSCIGSTCTEAGTATITIVEQSPVMVYEATAGPDPGETDDPDPEPTEEPVDPDPEPSDDPDPDPDPTPSGLITQNFRDGAKTATSFQVTGIAPVGTKVSVRVQVVSAGAGYDDSSWTTLACPVTGTTCTTQQIDFGTNGGNPRWGFSQLVLTNGSSVVYGDVGFWELVR